MNCISSTITNLSCLITVFLGETVTTHLHFPALILFFVIYSNFSFFLALGSTCVPLEVAGCSISGKPPHQLLKTHEYKMGAHQQAWVEEDRIGQGAWRRGGGKGGATITMVFLLALCLTFYASTCPFSSVIAFSPYKPCFHLYIYFLTPRICIYSIFSLTHHPLINSPPHIFLS